MLARLQAAFAPDYPRGYVGRHRCRGGLRALARRILGPAGVGVTGAVP